MVREGSRLARRLWAADHGQDLAEYGIALAVIAGFVGLVAVFIGLLTSDLWTNAETAISSAIGGS